MILIRSQDDEILAPYNLGYLDIVNVDICLRFTNENFIVLGKYNDRKTALKVVDWFQEFCDGDKTKYPTMFGENNIFRMPKITEIK